MQPQINPKIRRKIAIRKFFAIPVSIIAGTGSALYAAHIAHLSLDLDKNHDRSWLGDFWLAFVIGLLMSVFLAYTFKEFLKLRACFKMEYIFASITSVMLTTAVISFMVNALFFYPSDSIAHADQLNRYQANIDEIYHADDYHRWSHRFTGANTQETMLLTQNSGRLLKHDREERTSRLLD